MNGLRLLIVSTPVGPLGSGEGGGVESDLRYLIPALQRRGHQVELIAPRGSRLAGVDVVIHTVSGSPPVSAVRLARTAVSTVNPTGVLEELWLQAALLQQRFDAIISWSYDWLSFLLTPGFTIPVCHNVTMSSTTDQIDEVIRAIYRRYPRQFAWLSWAQTKTYHLPKPIARIIFDGVDSKIFAFRPHPQNWLGFAGRISPEKGVADAFAIARAAGLPLHLCGVIQDRAYWQSVRRRFSDVRYVYHGFLSHRQLAAVLGQCKVTLHTARWVEAFGTGVLQSIACGTPVVAYDTGGPREIIQPGKSGFLVPKGNIQAAAKAVRIALTLDRARVRVRAEAFTFDRLAQRYEHWLLSVVGEPASKASA